MLCCVCVGLVALAGWMNINMGMEYFKELFGANSTIVFNSFVICSTLFTVFSMAGGNVGFSIVLDYIEDCCNILIGKYDSEVSIEQDIKGYFCNINNIICGILNILFAIGIIILYILEKDSAIEVEIWICIFGMIVCGICTILLSVNIMKMEDQKEYNDYEF